MTCPTCKRELPGIGTYCEACGAYTVDMGGPGPGIVLPLPPNRANARWHWRQEKREKDEWWAVASTRVSRPSVTLSRAEVHATLYVWSKMDPDNLHARMKWPLDFLVEMGFLEDDSADHISLTVEQEVDRKNQRLEIRLEAR